MDTSRYLSARSILMAAAVLVSLISPTADAAPPRGVIAEYEGEGCEEFINIVPVSGEHIERLVPDRYEPQILPGGQGGISVAVFRCETVSVGDNPPVATITSEISTPIASPDGTPGDHFYLLWQITDNPALRSAVAPAGIAGAQVRDAVFDFDPPATARAEIPWQWGGFSLSAVGTIPVGDRVAGGTWWHDGPRGTMRIAYEVPAAAMGVGAGEVCAEEGSPLAEVMEQTCKSAAALLVTFGTFRATVTSVSL